MLKKILYIIMGLLMFLFIYNIYIKKTVEELPDTEIEKIETENIKYDVGAEYEIKAQSQFDDKKKEIQIFEIAQGIFKELKIKGKEAVVDKYKNIDFKGEIFGESASGWTFKTDQIKYNDKKNKFYTNTKIFAENKEEGLTLEAKSMEADSEFAYIVLSEKVKLISDDFEITCDNAIYNKNKKWVKLRDNINFKAKKLQTGHGELELVYGNTDNAIYYLEKQKLEVWAGIRIQYKRYYITGKNFEYYQESGNFNIYEDVNFKNKDINVKFEKGFFNKKTEKLVLTGPVRGTKGTYKFQGDYGEIFTETENVRLTGNVTIEDKEENTLSATEIFYNKKDEVITGKANNFGKISLKGEKVEVLAKNFLYNVNESKLYIENRFDFFYDEFKGKGNNLEYNTEINYGKLEDLEVSREKEELYSSYLEFDLDSKKYFLRNNVEMFSENYLLKSEKVILDEERQIVYINDDFTIKNRNEDFEIRAPRATYRKEKNEIEIDGKGSFYQENYEISGDDILYDLENKTGAIRTNARVMNVNDGVDIKANTAEYKNQNEIILSGDVNFNNKGNMVYTETVIYDIEKKIANFETEGRLENTEEELEVFYQNGNYNQNTNIGIFNSVNGSKEKMKFRGEKATVLKDEKNLKLTGNVSLNIEDIILSSNELIYNSESQDLRSEDQITIIQNDMTMILENGVLNVGEKIVNGNDVKVFNSEGVDIKGDQLHGDFNKKELNFKGNLEAKLDENTSFTGEMAKVFFLNEDGEKMKITRGEIKNKAKFSHNDMKLNSEYLEFDNMKKFVFGKGTSMLKLKETTDIAADYIYLDLIKEHGIMENNVAITNRTEEVGIVTANSNTAELDNTERIVKLVGDVITKHGETYINSDFGSFDLNKNIIKGKGNIKLKVKVDNKKEGEALKEEALKEEALKEEALKEEALKEEALKEEALKEELNPTSEEIIEKNRKGD